MFSFGVSSASAACANCCERCERSRAAGSAQCIPVIMDVATPELSDDESYRFWYFQISISTEFLASAITNSRVWTKEILITKDSYCTWIGLSTSRIYVPTLYVLIFVQFRIDLNFYFVYNEKFWQNNILNYAGYTALNVKRWKSVHPLPLMINTWMVSSFAQITHESSREFL